MPILVPQTALDAALAADKKARGILDEIPVNGFTAKTVAQTMRWGHQTAMRWCEKNGNFIGVFGPRHARIYVVKPSSRTTGRKKK